VASPVTVPEGKTSAPFAVTASEVSERRIAQVTASYRGQSKRAGLIVEPPGPELAEVAISPAEVSGGTPAEGVVRLAREAPRDLTVLLSSDTAAVTVPEAVTVARGQRQAGFSVQTTPGPRLMVATLTARYGSSATSAQLRLLPIGVSLAGVSLERARATGGEGLTGTVTLSGRAPEAVAVGLSTNQAAARVPSRVTVPAGASSAQFAVRTAEVERPLSVRVTATLGGVSKRASLTIAPVLARLETIAVSPIEVRGGSHIGIMVRLDRAVPETVAVPISCDRREVILPEAIRIEAGEREGTVAAATTASGETAIATISAAYGGVTKSVQVRLLVVAPSAQLSGLSLDPTTVRAGESATGTVTLSGPAAVAVVIGLTANSRAVRLLGQVTVPAGSDTAQFRVETDPGLPRPLSVAITAAQGTITKTALLSIEQPQPAAALTAFRLTSELDRTGVQYLTATVSLSGPAPAGGATVTLSSDEGGFAVPAVIVPAGRTQAALRFKAPRLGGASRPVAITAEYGGATRRATVTVVSSG
jgi:hypothetical protein